MVPDWAVFGCSAARNQALGVYLHRVFERKSTWLDPVFRPVEKLVYRVCGIDEMKEMRWTEYGVG
jgi:potassium-transporting ATPase potassium-binding subunit